MKTRLAGADDVPRIVDLINLAYRLEAFFVAGDRIDRAEVEAYRRVGAFHLISDGTEDLGCIYTRREPALTDRPPTAYLGLLSVHPKAQGRGLARQLMEAAERSVLEQGCGRIELVVVDLRQELPGFYRKFGYQIVGTRSFDDTTRLLRPASFLRMAKTLRVRSGVSAAPPTP